jgi:hypothetical protein
MSFYPHLSRFDSRVFSSMKAPETVLNKPAYGAASSSSSRCATSAHKQSMGAFKELFVGALADTVMRDGCTGTTSLIRPATYDQGPSSLAPWDPHHRLPLPTL